VIAITALTETAMQSAVITCTTIRIAIGSAMGE
jgi:hypothetical protein